MKNILVILFLSITSIVFSQEISVNDFKELNNTKAEIGESSTTKKALMFEELYKTYNIDEFKKTMFEHLRNTTYENIDDYFWYSLFLSSEYYNSIVDKELALEILKKGKIEIENRLKNKNNTEEQELYLSMTRCKVLWASGVYYFNEDDLKKGGEIFDLAYENPDCIHTFPAMDEKNQEEIYQKYSEYKKTTSFKCE